MKKHNYKMNISQAEFFNILVQQCKDLIAHGVPSLHFYTMMASDSVYKIAKEIY